MVLGGSRVAATGQVMRTIRSRRSAASTGRIPAEDRAPLEALRPIADRRPRRRLTPCRNRRAELASGSARCQELGFARACGAPLTGQLWTALRLRLCDI